MKRIAIVGTTGSGKSTLAMKAAQKLNCPFIELDALFWKPKWVQEDKEIFRKKVSTALAGSTWTVGGNYSIARDIIWQRADTLIWLDYSFAVTLWRLLRRTIKRVVTQEELWSGNRETWRNAFLSRDNLFLFALRTHFRRRRQLPIELARSEYQHLTLLRFTKTEQAENWLHNLVTPDSAPLNPSETTPASSTFGQAIAGWREGVSTEAVGQWNSRTVNQ